MLSLRGSILLSAIFHVVLFLALLLMSSTGRARVVYKPQYQVRLVRPQEVPSLAKPGPKEVAKPKPPQEAPKPKPNPKKVVVPKEEGPPAERKEGGETSARKGAAREEARAKARPPRSAATGACP